MQLNPAEISELIKSRIEGLAASSDIRNQGTVVSVSDGIVRAWRRVDSPGQRQSRKAVGESIGCARLGRGFGELSFVASIHVSGAHHRREKCHSLDS